jgi:hypothetical protein
MGFQGFKMRATPFLINFWATMDTIETSWQFIKNARQTGSHVAELFS